MQKLPIKINQLKPIKGYFVAIGKEEIASLKEGAVINTSRSGIYYNRKELVSTVGNIEALKECWMNIVEIAVPTNAIVPAGSNSKKFGIRSGNNIPIVSIKNFSITDFKKVSEEPKMLAVA
ncbi:MAG: hypothetical protein ACD_80C00145G0064 [uncultured bacterium (gcode 4)]|uniref:Uncharacterized protein n=1 Tax=uncultured bacterium (gcode 4) TaxID=1234023 RepID=K1X489_9BACT|nr:MAG: hypothetical protein ACD_80C00145G0064 [uncultured bacterium (gcode 4)]HBB03777.1 hypothetical protein [Candidatus Gracilibacteria bacterium]